MKRYSRHIVPFILVLASLGAFGQGTSLYVKNTELAVSGTALLYIPGDYEDATESTETVKTIVKGGGILSIGGNMINSGNTIMFNNVEVNKNKIGEILLSGGGSKSITSSVDIFFPNLTISNNTDVTFPEAKVVIDSTLDITGGSIVLNGDTIVIRDGGSIKGEANDRLTGSGGVRFEEFLINPGESSDNIIGSGLGVSSDNGVTMTLNRFQGTSYASVANNKTAKRIFGLEFAEVSGDVTFDDFVFNYADSDLNGLTESGLAIYATSDDGSSWIKLGGNLDESNNRVSINSITFDQSKDYQLVLAEAICDTRPDGQANIEVGGGSFNGNTLEVCYQDTVALSSDADYYEWRDNDGNIIVSNESLSFRFTDMSQDGKEYTLYERNTFGCESFTDYTIDIIPLPLPSFTHDPENVNSCFGTPVSFTSSASTEGTITRYHWDFGDNGAISTEGSPNYTFETIGSHNTKLVVENSYGCVSDTVASAVLVHPLPEAAFTLNLAGTAVDEVCERVSVDFVNETTIVDYNGDGGDEIGNVDYVWDFGDENSAGGDSTSTEFSPSRSYPLFGPKTITLMATDNVHGCADTVVTDLTVHASPQVGFHFEDEDAEEFDGLTDGICEGTKIVFDNTTTINDGSSMSYHWDFGDDVDTTSITPSFSPVRHYDSDDTFDVILTASTTYCEENAVLPITVHPAPEGDFVIQDLSNRPVTDAQVGICEGETIKVIPGFTGEYQSLDWDFGNGDLEPGGSKTQQFQSTYPDPKTGYKIKLTVTTTKNCSEVLEHSLNVHGDPVASFSTGDVCDGKDVEFFGHQIEGDSIVSYIYYNFKGDQISDAQDFASDTFSVGNHQIRLLVESKYGCTDETTEAVTVFQNPNLSFESVMVSCSGTLAYDPLTDPAIADPYPDLTEGTFTWSPESEDASSPDSELVTSTSTNFQLHVVTNVGGCEDTYDLNTYIIDPTDLGPDRDVCAPITLDALPNSAPVGTLTYTWTEGAYSASADVLSTSRFFDVTESGTYGVKVDFTLGTGESCSYEDQVEITIAESIGFSLPDRTICDGDTIKTLLFADTYSWTDQYGVEVSDQDNFEPTTAGLYKLTIQRDGCEAEDVFQLSLNDPPTADFNLSSSRVCIGEELTLTDRSRPFEDDEIVSWYWEFSDGTTSILEDPVKTFGTAETVTIELTVTSGTGCSNTYERYVTVDPLPSVGFNFSDACVGNDIALENTTTIPGSGTLQYAWDFGDLNASINPEPVKTYSEANTYLISLTARSEYGCESAVSENVVISPKPTGQFQFVDESNNVIEEVCVGQSFSFDNQIVDPASGTLDFEWDFGDGNSSDEIKPEHSFSASGIYIVSVTASTDAMCEMSYAKAIRVKALPTVDFSFADACVGSSVSFENLTTGSNLTHVWDFGDGASSTDASPNHTYATAGTYNVELTSTSKGCAVSLQKEITIGEVPVFDLPEYGISVTGSYLLNPSATAGASIPAGSSFEWRKGANNIISTDETVTITASGGYAVTVTSPDVNSCFLRDEISLYILNPQDLGGDRTVCGETTLNAKPVSQPPGTTLSYSWKKDDIDLSSTSSSIVVSESGTYEVTVDFFVTEYSETVSYTDEVEITVEPALATIDLGGTVNLCEGEVVTITSSLDGDSYQWTNTKNGDILGTEKSQEFTAAGQYQLDVTLGTCSTSGTVTIIEIPAPNADFIVDGTVCITETLSFNNISSPGKASDPILSYTWDFGDGSSSTLENPAKTYATAGSYDVSLTVQSEIGCADMLTKTVLVEAVPQPDFSVSDACLGETFTFTDLSTDLGSSHEYSWDFGDGGSSDVEEPSHLYSEAGIYDVSLTIQGVECSNTTTYQVEVFSLPEIDLGDEIGTCGSEIEIDAGAGMTSYRWYDVSDNSTLSTDRFYTETSDRNLGLEVVNANGCQKIEETEVRLNLPSVIVDLGADRTACGSTTLNAGSFPGGSFLWSTGETTNTIEVTSSGTYSVDVTDQHGCPGTDEVVITIEQQPELDLGFDQVICSDEDLTLDAGNPGADYVWSTGEISQTITVTVSGTYKVEVSYGGCIVKDSLTVTVLDPVIADFESDGYCNEMTTSFEYTGSSSVESYLWNFGDGTQSTQEAPEKTYTSSGNYDVVLTVTHANGCEAEITKSVEIFEKIDPDFEFDNACAGNMVSINNTSTYLGSGTLSYVWYFGDGESSTLTNPEHTYTEAGSYVITLEASTEESCTYSTTHSITIKENPVVTIQGDEASCNTSVLLDAQNTGSTFLWSDNSTGQTLEVTESGTYSVTVTDSDGCVGEDTIDVEFYEYDKPDLGEDLAECGELLLDPNVENSSFEWSTGATTSTLQVSESGTYWVKAISEDLCVSRDTVTVTVHPIPEFDLGQDIEVCADEEVVLSGETDVTVASYSWSTGETTMSIQPQEAGTYELTVTSDQSCNYTDDIEIVINELPVKSLAETYNGCEELTLEATSSDTYSYLWSTGSTNPTIDVTDDGEYWVKMETLDGCTSIDTTTVTIYPIPSLELGFDRTLCSGESVTLDAGNVGANYLWSNGATSQNITVTESGTYKVEVSYGSSCSVEDSVTVTIQDPVSIDFEWDGGCTEKVIEFSYTGSSAIVDYEWDFGDGSTSARSNPEKIFRSPGTYSVSLTVTDENGCTAEVGKSVVVAPKPHPNFAFNNACAGNNVSFTNSTTYAGSDELSYSWHFGDGVVSSDANPNHAYAASGEFIISLEATNSGGCTYSISKSIAVKASPNVVIEGDEVSCNTSVLLDAGNTGSTYRWSDNSTNKTLEVYESGTYSVEVTNANGCIGRDTIDVEIYEYDRADLGEDLTGCDELVLDPQVSNSTFRWSTGANSPTLAVNESGIYWVRVVSEDLCISRDTISVIVHPEPEFDLGFDQEFCEGEVVNLSGDTEVPVIGYLWNTGATTQEIEVSESGNYQLEMTSDQGCVFTDDVDVTFNETPENPFEETYVGCGHLILDAKYTEHAITWSTGATTRQIDVTESGTYSAIIETRAGCSIEVSTQVTINPLPVPDLGADIEICYGEEVTLDAGNFESYEWNGISGGRLLDVGVSGTYTVTVTNEFGCTQSDEVEVLIRPSLGLELGEDKLICENSDSFLDASIEGDGYTYEWNSNVGIMGTSKILDNPEPGQYWVTVTDSFGCQETDVVNVSSTTESIDASFLVSSEAVVGEVVHFAQLTEPEPEWYEWDFGDGFKTSSRFNPTKIYFSPGEYEVSLTVSNGVCENKETKTITVLEGRASSEGDQKVKFIEFYNVSVYPNPAQESVNIDFELSDLARIDIQVYDFAGMLVARHGMEESNDNIIMDISTMPSGSYILIMRAGGDMKKLRFVKMK